MPDEPRALEWTHGDILCETPPLPGEVQAILAAGGLIPFLKAHPDWKIA